MSINQKIWALALPIILSNISVPLLGLVDTAVVGHLSSSLYLAGVTLGATLFSFLFWGFGFLRMGTTGVVAQAAGKKDYQQVVVLLQQGIVLAIIVAGALLLSQSFLIPVGLELLTADREISDVAAEYAGIRIWAAPAVLINYVLLGWFLGLQNSRFSLLMLLLGNSLNIILDLVFVLVLQWQVSGVAFASVLADYATLLVGLTLAFKRVTALLPNWQLSLGKGKDFRRLLQVNQQLLVRTWILLWAIAFFTAQGAEQGADVLAANAILMQMVMFASYALDGFAHSAEALVGEASGAKNNQQMKVIIWHSAILSFIAAGVCSLLYGLLGTQIVGLMTNIPEVLLLAEEYLIWAMLIPIFAVGSYLFDGVYIGLTRADIMRNSVILATLLYLFVWFFSQAWGNTGLWLAFSFFMLFRSLGLFGHYWCYIKPELDR